MASLLYALNAADLTSLNTFLAGAGHTELQATTREHKHMLTETREDKKLQRSGQGKDKVWLHKASVHKAGFVK